VSQSSKRLLGKLLGLIATNKGEDVSVHGIDVVHDGDIVRITLERGAANAIDLPMAEEFGSALRTAVADRARLIVLAGGTRVFSAGGDLRAMRDADDSVQYVGAVATALHGGLNALAESDTLFLTAIRGAVAGAGLGVMLHADIALCTDDSTFRSGYGAAGLTPDMGLSYLLPRAIGELRARQLLLLGNPVNAATALSWGLVTEVATSDALDARIDELAAAMAFSPAANATKQLLASGRTSTLAAQLDAEARSIAGLFETADSRRRVSAFLDR
jgi:2-(1,2-epoxy-1,2-dihydrophenyl)acetyl-CoA isomerase